MSLALASPTNGAPVVADVPASVPGRFADLPIALLYEIGAAGGGQGSAANGVLRATR